MYFNKSFCCCSYCFCGTGFCVCVCVCIIWPTESNMWVRGRRSCPLNQSTWDWTASRPNWDCLGRNGTLLFIMTMIRKFTGPAQDSVLGNRKNQPHRTALRWRTKDKNTGCILLSHLPIPPPNVCVFSVILTYSNKLTILQDSNPGDKNFQQIYQKRGVMVKRLQSSASWGPWVTPVIIHYISPRAVPEPRVFSSPTSCPARGLNALN